MSSWWAELMPGRDQEAVMGLGSLVTKMLEFLGSAPSSGS